MHMVMSVYLKHVPSCIIWIIIEILKQKMEFYIMIKNCELNGLQKKPILSTRDKQGKSFDYFKERIISL